MTATGKLSTRDLRDSQLPGLSWYFQMTALTLLFVSFTVFPRLAMTWAVRGIMALNNVPGVEIPAPDELTAQQLADEIANRNGVSSPIENVVSPGAGVFAGVRLDEEQVDNAVAIVATGKGLGMSQRDIQIAVATAMQESSLRNLDHGDDWWFKQNGWSGGKSDSRGLFQQRESWGDEATRMNPVGASKLFFEALSKIENRDQLGFGETAQAVQNSAFPDKYDGWKNMTDELVDEIEGK